MTRLLLVLLATTCCLSLPAADVLNEFKSAMSGSDAQAKKQAISALANSSLSDDEVLPLLVNAAGDRQGGRYAIPALRKRTKLSPGPNPTGYPGYPTSDDRSGWSQWLSERTKVKAEEKKLTEALAKAEEAEKKAEQAKAVVTAVDLDGDGEISEAEQAASQSADTNGDGILSEEETAAALAALSGEAGADQAPVAEAPRQEDTFGKLDRLFFTDGSILRCYIMTKRTDLNGQLTSLRIVHRDGGGEEIIDAAVIARIEEDIQ